MKDQIEKFWQWIDSLPKEQLEKFDQHDAKKQAEDFDRFSQAYAKDMCHLCGKPFQTVSMNNPCLHWLLRRGKFKKKSFPQVYKKFSYGNIATFLRWCANKEKLVSNINDLKELNKKQKVLCSTIKWKNIEWTFDCTKNDFNGHADTRIDYPHYHFQMRIDGKPFIDFDNFHVPFTKLDLFVLTRSMMDKNNPGYDFGPGGGTQSFVDLFNSNPEMVLESSKVLHQPREESEDRENTLAINTETIITAVDQPITGKTLCEIHQESIRTGKPMSVIASKKLKNKATIKSITSITDPVPDMAERTEHKRR